ncbi:MAG: 30S ribosomal protein S3 [Candidatus Thermoplasmatota archaeon]|jgi:small subunit ribosomal protein S3|nr:30S ribosomal protein S3 [Candidatus Thermoplasmatota archaeon]MCL5963002.1 30S ribosomal protein S3 [Candidatus Thermoplasmatota archaeon]
MANEIKFITENMRRVLLKEFMQRETQRAGYGGVDIKRTPLGTRVTLTCESPGLVIGKKGNTIKELTRAISDKFKFDNPQIAVEEARNPNLNAQIMAEKLASALERGWQFKRAAHSTVRRIMQSGAKGCQIMLAGKLTGERHRTEKIRAGSIKYCGKPAEIFLERGYVGAKLKPGILGVTVWIMKKDAKLPDEITVKKSISEIKKEESKVHINIENKIIEISDKDKKRLLMKAKDEEVVDVIEEADADIPPLPDNQNVDSSSKTSNEGGGK